MKKEFPVAKEHALHRYPLLTTKLHIPSLSHHLIARPRLMAQLNEGMERKLTLISASAGYGKTALLCEWLETLEGKNTPIGWLSLDTGDNDSIRFWSYVCAALDQLHPGVGEQALILLQSPQPPPIESILTMLINALATVPKHFGLILDDFHLLTLSSIHHELTFFLHHMPLQMHLIMASRVDPPLALARLRARQQLIEVRVADLQFTSEEVTAFLQKVREHSFSTEEVAMLEVRMEGWIAGLQLAVLSLAECTPASRAGFLANFTGSHHYILSYLTEEVLMHQTEQMRAFLLQTSILDRLYASLCDAVTDGTNSQVLLEQLEQCNIFLIPLDNEGQWYRYRYFFAEFLYSCLLADQYQNTMEDTLPLLHSRASSWYEQQHLHAEAITHALSSKDFERAAHLIEQVIAPTLPHGEVVTLPRWLTALPETTLLRHPRLCLYSAQVLLFNNQHEAANLRWQDAERSLAEHGESMSPEDRLIFQGEMAALLSQIRATHSETTPYVNTSSVALRQHHERPISPSGHAQQQKRLQPLLDALSVREFEVLQCVAEGMSNQEIAEQMVIAESTVKWYLKNVYSKLNVHNRTQAMLKLRVLTE
ncbi:MAG: LuxR C-terminal-related transcriptional regulator [Ktedonobacteraceae bacterium]